MLYRSATFLIAVSIAASVACSKSNDRVAAALPTGPSATALTADGQILYVGGVSGPMDVLIPSRADSFAFRNDLENKYQSMGRPLTSTYVDKEGEVVWTQEYIRYRVNGCDHATAVQRVMTQIDQGPAGGICAAPPEGVILFPSRADSLEFRRQLESKYQSMGRGLTQTYVDQEGSVIWIQEYLRYRVNGCDHITAEQKVFAQIDGGPVQDVCRSNCTLSASPSGTIFNFPGGTGSFEVRPNQANCNINWTASSDSSWLTFPAANSPGTGFTTFPYSVAQNNGTTRFGNITITFQGGTTSYRVEQAGTNYNAGFTLMDPFRSGSQATDECHLRSTATPCNFTSFANLEGNSYTYSWTATYNYGGTQKTFTSTASTLSFTDTCGAPGSAADGPSVDLDVTLTILDNQGNSITLRSGTGNQPALRMRLFSC